MVCDNLGESMKARDYARKKVFKTDADCKVALVRLRNKDVVFLTSVELRKRLRIAHRQQAYRK